MCQLYISLVYNSRMFRSASRDSDSLPKDLEPLLLESREVPLGAETTETSSALDTFVLHFCKANPDFFKQAIKFFLCFAGLQASYLTWGYMQELIMTTQFEPTELVPNGKFPSAAFCVFSNRFLAVIVALIAVRVKYGSFFSQNTAPLHAFTPCALSNTISSWSQYASLKYVSFPVQTVFKSSKIIPVMIMGKVLKGANYPMSQYVEALLITVGVAIFSLLSKSSTNDASTDIIGLIFLCMYITSDSFTSQWQDKVYSQYGRANVDQYQMMLGVNVSAICITTAGLIITGDIPIVWQFLHANPIALRYNIITAITSASGQVRGCDYIKSLFLSYSPY
jgi:solute carrier family 35 (adenosine 3'-phospho 5'-phosphosulfate transporter), member B2